MIYFDDPPALRPINVFGVRVWDEYRAWTFFQPPISFDDFCRMGKHRLAIERNRESNAFLVYRQWMRGIWGEFYAAEFLNRRMGVRHCKPDIKFGSDYRDWADLRVPDGRAVTVKTSPNFEWGWTFQDIDPRTQELMALVTLEQSGEMRRLHPWQGLLGMNYLGDGKNLTYARMKKAHLRNKMAIYPKMNPEIKDRGVA